MKERRGVFSLLRGCDQSLEWIKARSSLHSFCNHSALDPLRVLHSRSRKNCSVFTPFKRDQGLLRGKKHVGNM